MIWAGGGVVLGNASAPLTAVAEFLQAAVVTTRQGKGAIDDRHPLSIGSVWVNKRLQPMLDDADVILAVGTHFLGNQVAADKVVVHVDVDPAEIGRHFANSVAVVGDAAPTLDLLLAELQKRSDPHTDRTAETPRCEPRSTRSCAPSARRPSWSTSCGRRSRTTGSSCRAPRRWPT